MKNPILQSLRRHSELTYEQEQMIENEKLDVTVLHNISDVDTVL